MMVQVMFVIHVPAYLDDDCAPDGPTAKEISSYEGGTIENPDGIFTYTYSKTFLHQKMHYLLTIDGK